MDEKCNNWVVLELTPKAENEDPDMVKASIKHHIRDAEVFIPASVVQRGEQRVCHYLVDGYAFIRHCYPENYYSRLVETKYVQGPLYVPSMSKKDRKLAFVTSEEVESLKSQIKVEVDQGIEVGDTVLIVSGPYREITAIVREDIPETDSVVAHIQLRSTDRLVTLPRAFLQLKSKPPLIAYKSNFDSILTWAAMAKYLSQWESAIGLDPLYRKFRAFSRWNKWLYQSREKYFFIQAFCKKLDFTQVWSKFNEFRQLSSGLFLRDQILTVITPPPKWGTIRAKYQEVSFLSGACKKMIGIYSDMKYMIEPRPFNLIVDGTQLFIRCALAPGLGTLIDSKGRPTGPIVGFLKSLGAYKKRFPEAHIYVCWDGSSQRRKAIYPDYKANRHSHSDNGASFGMGWLRETLPLLGILQAFNPVEEADDVIASLVKGKLKDDLNIIISSDRDMLQLVSEFTHLLSPNVGLSKEKLYDPAMVESEYGVPPKSIVHIRALSGDNSDNILGISGFGLKTASKLIKLYGTVSILLGSNLAGLGKSQLTKLRENEQRVRDNVELLTLQDVPFDQITSNPNQIEVAAKLKELEIKSDSVLAAYFPRQLDLF